MQISENLWFDNLCAEYLGDGLKFVFSPDIILGLKYKLSNLTYLRTQGINLPEPPKYTATVACDVTSKLDRPLQCTAGRGAETG